MKGTANPPTTHSGSDRLQNSTLRRKNPRSISRTIPPPPTSSVVTHGAQAAVVDPDQFRGVRGFRVPYPPAQSDKASKARIWYFTFHEYPDRWRQIWDVFSREAVWDGRFDQFSESKGGRRGTSTVDAEFLKEIEGWRETLARNMALRNPRLSHDDLNKAVQLTIDRIIFLRMAEDRGIEPYERLLKLTRTAGHLPPFHQGRLPFGGRQVQFRPFPLRRRGRRRERARPPHAPPYSGRQGPQADSGRPVLSLPYEFRVMPVEILGNVYEQFLGKVIRLTKGHQAKVEEKPEVRKAGGVYYTPAYIVDYIVKNTVGR